MDLWYAPTSAFARKVHVCAYELGLAGQICLREVNPWTDAELRWLNPLAKVPTLVAGEGLVLYESAVICDYLDSLGAERRLFPPDGLQRWRALLLQGLADGACTAAGRLFADERKPEDRRDPAMMARFRAALDAALDALEAETLARDAWTIGEVGAAVLLGYLDFRWLERHWRTRRPALADWFATAQARPSMAKTAHRL